MNTYWVLIIIIHGWGAGTGSNGNAIGSVDFILREDCEAARAAIAEKIGEDSFSVCVKK